MFTLGRTAPKTGAPGLINVEQIVHAVFRLFVSKIASHEGRDAIDDFEANFDSYGFADACGMRLTHGL
jgi:hypothetical protein